MNLKSISNLITLLLALAGCLISIVLTVEHFSPSTDIGCSKFGGDCAATIKTVYGHIGPIPTSILGLGMYGALAGLCVLRFRKMSEAKNHSDAVSKTESGEGIVTIAPVSAMIGAANAANQLKTLDYGVWGLSLLGTAISIWLQYVSLIVLFSFCPWCLSSCVAISLICLLSSRDLWFDGKKLAGEQKLLGYAIAGISVMLSFVYVPVFLKRLDDIKNLRSDRPTVMPLDKRELLLDEKNEYFKGPSDGYTLIKFGDYQCPPCKKANDAIPDILKNEPRHFRFAFRNYPISEVHRNAQSASTVAEAAGKQGKFWEMHDLLYSHQADLERDGFQDSNYTYYAKSLNLNMAKFEKDRASSEVLDKIAKDKVVGGGLGVQSTPTFFIVSPNKKIQALRVPGIEALMKVLKEPKDPIWQ